ncbi:MAG: hypothetical protein M8353_11735 [ANME-2 cluster archaeon]|nr:hypothetical protein [ANME-2 cluster archaeon]
MGYVDGYFAWPLWIHSFIDLKIMIRPAVMINEKTRPAVSKIISVVDDDLPGTKDWCISSIIAYNTPIIRVSKTAFFLNRAFLEKCIVK